MDSQLLRDSRARSSGSFRSQAERRKGDFDRSFGDAFHEPPWGPNINFGGGHSAGNSASSSSVRYILGSYGHQREIASTLAQGKRSEPVPVDAALTNLGFVRGRSDTSEFICLIDSIHQQLNHMGLGVSRNTLVQQVRKATQSNAWDMLDVLGAEGKSVLEAAAAAVKAEHGVSVQFDVNVFMTMPDNTVVPYLQANNYRDNSGGSVREMNLLFINNNHYEPLFRR